MSRLCAASILLLLAGCAGSKDSSTTTTGSTAGTGGGPGGGGGSGTSSATQCANGPLSAPIAGYIPTPLPKTGDFGQDCVDRINQFRWECQCLPPLQRWTEAEACPTYGCGEARSRQVLLVTPPQR